MTFVKFNYRNTEINNISYNEAFKKVVQRDKKYLNKSYLRKQYSKGTMNITELWSERSMQQVLGSMPYPRDRLKILKLYQQDKHNLISSQGIG